VGTVAGTGEMRNTYTIIVGKSEGKRPLGKPKRRWEDTIKMNVKGIRMWRCWLDSSDSG